MENRELYQWQTTLGSPVAIGNVTVIPESRALTIRWPYGGLVWNRPTAILVERGEDTERIPIVDVTRWAQLGLFGFSLAFSMVLLVLSALQRRDRNE